MITRNHLVLLIITCTVFVGIHLYSDGQNKMKPEESLKTSKDRSPGQIFAELAQSDGVYIGTTYTYFSTNDSKSPLIVQQVFYANKSNALARITINKDKYGFVLPAEYLRNIVYLQGKVFEWEEGATNGLVYKATMDEVMEYLSLIMMRLEWATYQGYLYDPSLFTAETHNNVLSLKPRTKTEMDDYIIQLCVLQKPFVWISSIEVGPDDEKNITIRREISLPKKQCLPPSGLITVPNNIQFKESSNPHMSEGSIILPL